MLDEFAADGIVDKVSQAACVATLSRDFACQEMNGQRVATSIQCQQLCGGAPPYGEHCHLAWCRRLAISTEWMPPIHRGQMHCQAHCHAGMDV